MNDTHRPQSDGNNVILTDNDIKIKPVGEITPFYDKNGKLAFNEASFFEDGRLVKRKFFYLGDKPSEEFYISKQRANQSNKQ